MMERTYTEAIEDRKRRKEMIKSIIAAMVMWLAGGILGASIAYFYYSTN